MVVDKIYIPIYKVGNSPPEGSEFPIYREVPDQREEVRRGYFI